MIMNRVFLLHLDLTPKCLSSDEIAPYLRNIRGDDPKGIKGKYNVLGDRIYDFLSVSLVRKLREELGDVFVGLYFVDPYDPVYHDEFEGVISEYSSIIFNLHSSAKLDVKVIKNMLHKLIKEKHSTLFKCITNYEVYKNPKVFLLKPQTREHFGGILDEL